MPRYIDTEQTDEVIKTELGMYDTTELKEMLKYFPTADVAPVVHAHWILKDTGLPECSHCGGNCLYMADYCPNCGAKMDEEVKQ